ncbi:hypothetical protein [Acetobacter sp.]|jgi:hypothetical protein|uniref:hypothetical protein n=1 Tax=Acetobacter sp. TaxID=440 RepID=UPI0025BC6922|nr:hypothetical protein [Acetobacter sp.]MCH4091197.1 BREX-1 system adenine-specific DNA-methyltransferase PglX [Acetobacter sp.]MCI1301366.1 BREX-1 system adenine-specific DNA-methyltransferase PglX [Acetobacter sp.]
MRLIRDHPKFQSIHSERIPEASFLKERGITINALIPGDFRRWYGNAEHLVNWENDGVDIRNFLDEKGYIRSLAQNTEYYFNKCITLTFIISSNFGVRMTPKGYILYVSGSSTFIIQSYTEKLTAF